MAQNVLGREALLEFNPAAAQVADEFARHAVDGFLTGELVDDFGVASVADVFERLTIDFAAVVVDDFFHW